MAESCKLLSPPAGENCQQLLRRNDFELSICTVAWLPVRAPPSKLGHVTEAHALHVLVGDLDYELGSQRFPRQVLALAPAALATGHAAFGFAGCGFAFRPSLPGVSDERILAVGREVFYEFAALLIRETRA